MENLLAFVGAASLALAVFELLDRLARPRRLSPLSTPPPEEPEMARLPTWVAFFAALMPDRFSPGRARDREQVIDLLRRAGYPYPTLGAYYASAVLIFAQSVLLAAILAVLMLIVGMDPMLSVLPGVPLLVRGIVAPKARLKNLIEKRAKAFRANAVVGLSALAAMLEAGVSPADAMRQIGESVGGAFCNWLGFLAARMEVEDLERALERARQHLPDPRDPEFNLLLHALRNYFHGGQPLLPSVESLRQAMSRAMIEETAQRASVVQTTAVAWGVLAIMGMVFSFMLPAVEMVAGIRR